MNDASSGGALSGSATDGALLREVLPFLTGLGRTGRLVGGGLGEAPLEVWMEDGQVVDAAWGAARGLAALELSAVFLARVSFVFSEGARCEQPVLAMTAQDLTAFFDEAAQKGAEPRRSVPAVPVVPAVRVAGSGAVVEPLAPPPATPGTRSLQRPRALIGFVALAVVGVVAVAALSMLRPEPPPGVSAAPPESTVARAPTQAEVAPLAATPTPKLADPTLAPSAPSPTVFGSAQPAPGLAVPGPSPSPEARLLLDEHFAAGAPGWPNDPSSSAWADALGYHLTPRTAGRFVAVAAPVGQDLSNVVVAGTFRKTGGPDGGGYGLLLRDQGASLDGLSQAGRYYVFEVTDRGEVGVWRRDEDHWLDLLPWTMAAAVHAGIAENRLEVRAVGAVFTFVVNDIQVVQASDAALPTGAVGVFVGGDGNQVLLVRFTTESIKT